MFDSQLVFISLEALPAKEDMPPAWWLNVADPAEYERLGFIINDAAIADRLGRLTRGQPVALRVSLRQRRGGGLSARVLEVGLPKKAEA